MAEGGVHDRLTVRRTRMLISEIYHSIQGEGKLTGVPSVFVRTSGCNLRCAWCDSGFTSWNPEGQQQTVAEIISQVQRFPCRHVVLTGGEPLIAQDVVELTQRLQRLEFHITIETAGTVWHDVACHLASISPKLANSTPSARDPAWAKRHDERRINHGVLRRFMEFPDYQLKFVVDQPDDIAEIDALLAELGGPDAANVLLMPQGIDVQELDRKKDWLLDICKERGFRFCPRLHIAWFGHTRGT